MFLQCPYDEWSITIAKLSVSRKLEAYEKANGENSAENVIVSYTANLPQAGTVEYKEAVASSHGISLLDLANSPNRENLIADYDKSLIKGMLEHLKSTFSLTDVEAWCILVQGANA